MAETHKGSGIRMTVGGVDVGKLESFSAVGIFGNVDAKSYKLPSREITLQGATFAPGAIQELFGQELLPKYDIEVAGWRRIAKLPNGRTRLPKKKRLQKKWLKRYYTKVTTLYRGCSVVSSSQEVSDNGSFTFEVPRTP